MAEIMTHILFVGEGILLSLQLLLGGLLIGLVVGTGFAVLRFKGIAAGLIQGLISLLRGTPLILQLSVIYFSVPGLLGFKLSILAAGLLTFGLNSAAYIAEIMRAGIESLPIGQFEAAKALQIPNFYIWRDIVLPQVLRNIFPAMLNELIALLKETALISTIGGMDLMRKAQTLAAAQFTYFMPLCIAGAYYYGLTLLIEYAGKKIAQRRGYAPLK